MFEWAKPSSPFSYDKSHHGSADNPLWQRPKPHTRHLQCVVKVWTREKFSLEIHHERARKFSPCQRAETISQSTSSSRCCCVCLNRISNQIKSLLHRRVSTRARFRQLVFSPPSSLCFMCLYTIKARARDKRAMRLLRFFRCWLWLFFFFFLFNRIDIPLT